MVKQSYVLDSYSVLAYLYGEKESSIVEKILEKSKRRKAKLFISMVNFGEVYYKLFREEGEEIADKTIATVSLWPLRIVPATVEITLKAARVEAIYKLHYSDAFAVATALDKEATVVTGDREFKLVEELLDIHWLT